MAKVSVIIPVYNAEKYLRQCLDSVLNQTLKDIEVICVNDSATDGSLDILNEYAEKDPRVKVVTQPNAGAGAARNRGMDMAQGEFLSFLDADDFFEPQMLEKALEKAQQDLDDIVVFGSDQYREDETSAAQPGTGGVSQAGAKAAQAVQTNSFSDLPGSFVRMSWVIRMNAIPPYQPFNQRQLTDNIFKVFVGWAWDKLFRTSFIQKYGLRYQEQRSSNDLLFVFGAIALAGRISVIPDVFVHQRRDSSDSISKTREKSWHCFYDALQALRALLERENLYQELEKDFINYALHFTLWNYDTLAEPTKTTLKNKLNEEWFDTLGIRGKGEDYFYNKKEYAHYLEILDGADVTNADVTDAEVTDQAVHAKSDAAPDTAASAKANAASTASPATPAKKAATAASSAPAKSVRKGGLFSRIAGPDPVLETVQALQQQLQDMMKKQVRVQKELNHVRDMLDRAHKRNCELFHEQDKKITELKTFVEDELQRRDDWPVVAEEHRRKAAGRPIWVIKCPAPDNESKIRWGDYPFALSLQKNLEKLGLYVIVQLHEDWGCEIAADVVVVLRGSHFYRPDRRNANCRYIMWNLSHPDWVSDAEYELYDIVCVGSRHYAKLLQERLTVPVHPLLQCTDTDLFYPAGSATADTTAAEHRFDYIFIGNSRGVARSSVMWAVQDQLPLTMWGSGWNKILEGHLGMIYGPHIENSEIPELYRSAKVTLNDHWADMLEKQFVNNRIFDALACGLPVISDTCDELREIFPTAVLHYGSRKEFEECVKRIETDYDSVKAEVLKQQELIRREYSFEARAKTLKALAEGTEPGSVN